MDRTFKLFTALICICALVAPGAAFAQATDGYGDDSSAVLPAEGSDAGPGNGNGDGNGNPNGNSTAGDSGSGPSDTQSSDGGSLPFTGADLGVVGGAGAMLILLGFGLRRMTHRPSQV